MTLAWSTQNANNKGDRAMLSRIAGLFVLTLVFSVGLVRAETVDSFDAGIQSLYVSSSQHHGSQQVDAGTDVAIGEYRDLSLDWTSGFLDFANVMVSGTDGLFMFNEYSYGPLQSTGVATLTWDGADSPNVRSYSLGKSFKNDDRFLIEIDATAGMDLALTVYSSSTLASTASISVPNGYSGEWSIPFTNFSQASGAAGPVDFSDVQAIELILDGTSHPGSSIILNSIRTAGVSVPEPSMFALLSVMTLSLLGFRRRW
jgi:hypothetical protein